MVKGNRILYAKITPTKFVSVATVPTFTKGEVRIYYDLHDQSYTITSALGTEVIVTGRGISKHMLLRSIRKELDKMGSPLSRETRVGRLSPEERAIRELKKARKIVNRLVPKSKEELEEEIRKLTAEIVVLKDEVKFGT